MANKVHLNTPQRIFTGMLSAFMRINSTANQQVALVCVRHLKGNQTTDCSSYIKSFFDKAPCAFFTQSWPPLAFGFFSPDVNVEIHQAEKSKEKCKETSVCVCVCPLLTFLFCLTSHFSFFLESLAVAEKPIKVISLTDELRCRFDTPNRPRSHWHELTTERDTLQKLETAGFPLTN